MRKGILTIIAVITLILSIKLIYSLDNQTQENTTLILNETINFSNNSTINLTINITNNTLDNSSTNTSNTTINDTNLSIQTNITQSNNSNQSSNVSVNNTMEMNETLLEMYTFTSYICENNNLVFLVNNITGPLQGVKVDILHNGEKKTFYSDNTFKLISISDGSFIINATKEGYKPQLINYSLTCPKKELTTTYIPPPATKSTANTLSASAAKALLDEVIMEDAVLNDTLNVSDNITLENLTIPDMNISDNTTIINVSDINISENMTLGNETNLSVNTSESNISENSSASDAPMNITEENSKNDTSSSMLSGLVVFNTDNSGKTEAKSSVSEEKAIKKFSFKNLGFFIILILSITAVSSFIINFQSGNNFEYAPVDINNSRVTEIQRETRIDRMKENKAMPQRSWNNNPAPTVLKYKASEVKTNKEQKKEEIKNIFQQFKKEKPSFNENIQPSRTVMTEKPAIVERKPSVEAKPIVIERRKEVIQEAKPIIVEAKKEVIQEAKPVIIEKKEIVQEIKPAIVEEKKNIISEVKSAMQKSVQTTFSAFEFGVKAERNPKPELKMKVDKPVEKGKEFILATGEAITNLKQLKQALLRMDANTFNQHVTIDRNDFATWIYHNLEEKELAEKIGPIKNKYELMFNLVYKDHL